MTTAHPVSGHPHVDFPLALTAGAAALLVFFVAVAVPAAEPMSAVRRTATASWAGTLSPAQVVVRVLAVILLAVAIAAGRLGLDDELENLAPALVVGAGWPLLVLASALVGPVWRWADPWDGIARVLSRHDDAGDHRATPSHVWPAVLLAGPLVWFVSAHPDPLDPRAVGLVLALYTIVTVAGCIASGRARWLATAEPVGIVLSWVALLPRRRLADWGPPRGAEALLGVVAAGVLFGAVRRSELWVGVNLRPGALVWATVALAAGCAVLAVFLLLLGRLADDPGGRAGVVRAVVPAVAGIVVAVALERNRLFTSVQLLPGLLGDPFGLGWDLLGPSVAGLDPAPLGAGGLLALQLGVLGLGHLAGAVVVARRLKDNARLPGATALLHLMAGSILAVGTH